MGLQAILEAIRASGRARLQEIETRTEAETEQIMTQAEAEAQRIREESRRDTICGATGERARILHQARLESIQVVGNMQQTLVDMALDQVRERLAQWRSMPIYPALLRSLIEEALATLEGSLIEQEQTRLHGDPRDRPLLEDILRDTGPNLHVSYPLNSWGGTVVTSSDGRVVVDNTLEVRLQRAEPYLRRHLPILLEQEPLESENPIQ
jgi:vacuolar-type H+-ATPase subunit E/Vma4